MNKGIVMELSGKSVIVMTPEGAFEEIPREKRNCEIGEEIWYAAVRSRRRKGGRTAIYSSIAAAIVFCIVVFAGIPGLSGGQKVMAYVSLDINPSIEIGVDGKQNVLELNALNDDARALIYGLKFKGQTLDAVTEMLLSRAEAGYLSKGEADIVISSTAVDGKVLNDAVLSSHLKEVVSRYVEKEHPKEAEAIAVTAFPAPPEVREAAIGQGISPGKYVVYLNAKENGVEVQLEQFKTDSVHNIAKEAGGIGQLVKPEQLNDASISDLLKREKSGELDRKLKEKKAEETTKPGKSTTGKPASTPARPAASTPSKPSVKPAVTPSPANPSSAKPTGKPKEEDKGNNGNGNKQESGKAGPESSSPDKNSANSGKQDSGKDEGKQNTPRPTADNANGGQKKNTGEVDNKKDSQDNGQNNSQESGDRSSGSQSGNSGGKND